MCCPHVILTTCLAVFCLTGCTALSFRSPFANDPLTGGVNSGTSQLLTLSVPPGMQLFPSHGGAAPEGGGLEIYRGRVPPQQVAQYMYTGLSGQGWNLRLARRKGHRALYVYQRQSSLAVLTLEHTALGSLLCIWTGESLPDGATLPNTDQPLPLPDSPAPFSEDVGVTQQAPTVEPWGNTPDGLEERRL